MKHVKKTKLNCNISSKGNWSVVNGGLNAIAWSEKIRKGQNVEGVNGSLSMAVITLTLISYQRY